MRSQKHVRHFSLFFCAGSQNEVKTCTCRTVALACVFPCRTELESLSDGWKLCRWAQTSRQMSCCPQVLKPIKLDTRHTWHEENGSKRIKRLGCIMFTAGPNGRKQEKHQRVLCCGPQKSISVRSFVTSPEVATTEFGSNQHILHYVCGQITQFSLKLANLNLCVRSYKFIPSNYVTPGSFSTEFWLPLCELCIHVYLYTP